MTLIKIHVSSLFAYNEIAINVCFFQHFVHAYDIDNNTKTIDFKTICVRDAIVVSLNFLRINFDRRKKCVWSSDFVEQHHQHDNLNRFHFFFTIDMYNYYSNLFFNFFFNDDKDALLSFRQLLKFFDDEIFEKTKFYMINCRLCVSMFETNAFRSFKKQTL